MSENWNTRPRWITPHDASRCYVLYDNVDCNIPRWGTESEHGAWAWARGLLVELHRRLGGTLVSLHYEELLARHPHDPLTAPPHLPVGNHVTARLRTGDGHSLTIVSRAEWAPHGPRGDHWELTIDGETPSHPDDPALHGLHRYPPTLPFLALQVYMHLHRRDARPTTQDQEPTPSHP
ncbi:hypothetical protein [Alloactinosynnema sp. L-07]|uniref:hypothetical protein n=1 Tax=Alloactinosynnema sp. L-07 TaxID=1653480 RepID=UPI00065EF551|nr:hypothetical protein [Alloactinosynnema sp. L-07]CRK56890.1 hypothetical protein [Alloactinosynnema sp. L-07]